MSDQFVYREGDAVPLHVDRVVLHPSVKVIPPHAFSGRRRLRDVVLNEGLAEIGVNAFRDCISLPRVDCPSTLVRIRSGAFAFCSSLTVVALPGRGLEEIGAQAFLYCASLGRFGVPSTVARVGREAFRSCASLAEVEMTGVELTAIEREAFLDGPPSARIAIPPRAIVVEAGGAIGSVSVSFARRGLIRDHSEQLIMTSGYLRSMPLASVAGVATAIRRAVCGLPGDPRGGVRRRSLDDGAVGRARASFAECELLHKKEVASVLELALWKFQMDGVRRTRTGRVDCRNRQLRGRQKRLTKDDRIICRVNCKADPIVHIVFSFLDGGEGK